LDKKQERIALLERQTARVQKHRALLDRRSNRYSWVRVTIFFGGLLISVAAGFLASWWIGVVLACAALLAFAIVVHFHGKIERSLNRHTLWLHIKTTHVARMRLDWRHIPDAPAFQPQANHPFEIDLDISGPRSIHQVLNTAVSHEGSQRLHDWLLDTELDLTAIRERQELVRELTPLTRFRDRLTLNSLRASKRINEQLEGNRLLNWLNRQSPAEPLLPLLIVSAALNALTIALFALSLLAHFPQYWILSLLSAIVFFYVMAGRRGDTLEDADYLSYALATLGAIFGYLEKYPYGEHRRLKKLCAPFFQDRALRPSVLLRDTARIAGVATLSKNGLLQLILNALLPWDISWACLLSRYKARVARSLPTWLDKWFELEALCSLATFAYLNPEYTLPEVMSCDGEQQDGRALFVARELGHPLIPVEKKVTNDFALERMGEVVIITGSNMSGKSTFLRTLGVNLCLAFAGGPVNASTLRTVLFRIFTCIRVSDSVTDGYSYFYAEVRRLRALLSALEQNDVRPLFFLIDEIFKGTNNRERLIGSRAYVHALVGRNCLGAISTHDLELVRLADLLPQVENYHFREEVMDWRMVFDYRLRPGPCPTTNALKIMRMEGLPVEGEE
jgi:ABC-type multidrug transport system fused ATPase/permease subunit